MPDKLPPIPDEYIPEPLDRDEIWHDEHTDLLKEIGWALFVVIVLLGALVAKAYDITFKWPW